MERDQLMQRAHTRRSVFRVLGESGIRVPTNTNNFQVEKPKEVDFEIFDDADFYDDLLKEAVENPMAGIQLEFNLKLT